MNLVDKLEIWGFEKGIAQFCDSSLGFGFRISPYDISCASDEAINLKRGALRAFLSSLPTGIDIQFVQCLERERQEVLREHQALAVNAIEVVQSLTRERVEKFSGLNEAGALPRQENLVFVRIPPPRESARRIRNLFRKEQELTERAYALAMKRAETLAAELERNLAAAGLSPRRLGATEITKMVFDTWNPGHSIGMGEFDESDIRDRVLCTDLVKEVTGFRLGKVHHRVVTLKIMPEETVAGLSQALMDLPFASKLFVSIHVPGQEKEVEWLKLNRRMAYAMATGKKGVSDLESEAKLADIEDLLNEVVKNGEKILKVSLAVTLRSSSEEALDEQVSHVLQVMRDLGGAEGLLENYAALDTFAAAAIPNARCPERIRRMTSSNLADLLPVYGLFQGAGQASVLLRNRMGSLFRFDPFSLEFTNANQIISGGSGAGKSYLVNLLLGQMLGQLPRIYILDVGGSYQKTCSLLGGQYIPLAMNSGFTLNPFDVNGAVTDEKIKFLTALIQIMTKEEDRKALGKLERAEIERAIQAVYAEDAQPGLTALRARLLESELPEVKRIGQILSLWCGNSPYGKFLDRPTNISLSARVVCFDLKGLESNPDLQAAMLYTITDMVWREVQRDRTEMKFLIFDECWRLLESEAGSQFVGEVFRTFRKYYASAVAISQNIDDFAVSRAASAIMPNAAIKWILKQGGADFKRLAEVLRLNERETALVQSLTQVKGEFSEAFLMAEAWRAVISIESTPLEHWLATTDPKDLAILNRVAESTKLAGLDLLKHLADHHPNGARGA
jgi:conjugal transfer ATP-binding protein TraC